MFVRYFHAKRRTPCISTRSNAKWTLAALPIIPTSFRFIVRADKQKQFDILRELMRREDVAEVVNACDAGQCGWVT